MSNFWGALQEVKAFFHAGNNPLGRLLEFFSSKEKIPYSNSTENVVAVFKAFQNKFITDPIATKNNFEELRKLQKKFEDIFSSVPLYNNLGLLLETQPQGDPLYSTQLCEFLCIPDGGEHLGN